MTNVLSEGSAGNGKIVRDDNAGTFHWSAVIAGALVAAATTFFLVTLGAGVGLSLTGHPGATFFTLGAIWVLAAQAFGFATGGHVAGRIIGPAVETKHEEEFRAGLHGLAVWAIAVVFGLVILALAVAAGASGPSTHNAARSDSAIATYWTDILLQPAGPHAMARGSDLEQDKAEASRMLVADLHPGAPARDANRDDLVRLAAMDAGLSQTEAQDRVNFVEGRMVQEMDTARKAAGYASLWLSLALLFGAVIAVAAAISARWQDDKLSFSMARRY